jgi:hypothetical protein
MVATANDETFKEFNKHQEAAEALMVASGTAAAVGLYASMGLVTTQTVAPLATWGLAGVAGIFTTGSLPVVTSTALAVTSWPVLLTAAAVVGGLRYRARLHSGKRDTLHKKMNVHQTCRSYCFSAGLEFSNTIRVVVRAWKVVHDSQLLLTWINCSDGLHPIFADSQSQTRWAQFITRVREASGGETSAIDFDPAAVKSYLDEQRGLLELWLQEHTVREDESGNVTEDE